VLIIAGAAFKLPISIKVEAKLAVEDVNMLSKRAIRPIAAGLNVDPYPKFAALHKEGQLNV
jgi:hypothetical protein